VTRLEFPPARAASVDPAHVPDFPLGSLLVRPAVLEVVAGNRRQTLERRVMQVLVALAQAEGEIVSRDELIQRCWQGRAVGEDALQRCIGRIRRLAEASGSPAFSVESIRGVGYRLRSEPSRASGAPSDRSDEASVALPSRPRPWGLAAAGLAILAGIALALVLWRGGADSGAAGVPHPKSVAVLPFRDLAPDAGRAWFAAGLTEEVINSLTSTPDLRVASRQVGARLATGEADLQGAARAAGVAHVLEGSVRRGGDRVRVSARLIRASDGAAIWSQSYDRKNLDVISIQEEIAFDIARALRSVLEPARLRAMVETGTRSVEAYEAYLRGLAADQRQLNEGDIDQARAAADAYELARTLDPTFAAAHWKSARSWFGNATRVDSQAQAQVDEAERARRFFERIDAAIATSRNETETYRYRAFAAAMRVRPREAHRLMARYLRDRPRDIDAWEDFADISAWAGERGALRAAAERVHALSLESGEPRSRAITLSVMGLDLEAAAERADRQLALSPDRALTQYQAHRAFLWSGRIRDARELLERVRASDLPSDVKALAELRQACAEGRRADAVRWNAALGTADASSRWIGWQTMGRPAAANALLRTYDRPERLPVLMQFAIDPSFDSSAFPVLSAQLGRNGVSLPAPTPPPASCAPA
jgi:TolB-like protein/DNA-binding winged helix-turn-helix (wHTH) protein